MSCSILILTLNEEQNLPACLESVAWSDDVVVLDSFSTDHTVDVAQAAGARVIRNRFVDFAAQRNHGLGKGELKHGWVLHLDADERVTPELRDEIVETIARPGKDAYRVASRMMFQGRWIRHASMYPAYQVRLGRRDKLRFVEVGHGQREDLAPDQVGTLREDLLHDSFSKGLSDWWDRHNRYSSREAEENLHRMASGERNGNFLRRDPVLRRRALKEFSARLPCRPMLRFLYMYVLRRGFLDGVPGYHYCRLLAIYEYMIVLKMREMQRRKAGFGM